MWRLSSALCFSLIFRTVTNVCAYPVNEEISLIVNGWDAVEGEFPWQVSLAADGLYHFCGGSLIAPRWVLTARHCVYKNGEIMKDITQWLFAVVGAHDVRRYSWSHDAQKIQVEKVFIRPERGADIALLKLSTPANTSRSDVLPVKLGRERDRFIGYRCLTSGWGQYLENEQHTDIPKVLQKTHVTIYPLWICRYFWGDNRIYDFDICTADLDSTPCMGDSGGPLICKNDLGDPLLIGVTSWGADDCEVNFPSIYKRVSHWHEWIQNITKRNFF